MTRRTCGALSAAAIAALMIVPGAATAADDQLACQLTPAGAVTFAFGNSLPHVKKAASATSPTAPAPEDHTVDGGDHSECDALAWTGKFHPVQFKQIKPPKYRVPKGVGWLTVATVVPDDGPEGENWDADTEQENLLKAADGLTSTIGGEQIDVPDLGDRSWGFWLGAKERHAIGIWRDADYGFIEIEVSAHRQAQDSLREAARKIVPNFLP